MRRSVWILVLGVLLGVTVQHTTPAYPGASGPQLRELHRLRAALAWQKHERRHDAHQQWRLAYPTLRDAAFIATRIYPSVDPWALLRVVHCETRGSYRPGARRIDAQNPSSGALGPAQFLASTWRSTPFARWSPANAYIAILAMTQIVAHDGDYHQWACRWAA